jgi:hypothetical protein
MLGLTSGEMFVVAFIVIAVVTAPFWPRLGEAIAGMLARDGAEGEEQPPGEETKAPPDEE